MFGLFNNKPLLDDASQQWIVDTFSWAMANFDSHYFYQKSVLVLPSNQFFPGRVDSAAGMAGLIFDKVKAYAGISHWPTLLEDQNQCSLLQLPDPGMNVAVRGVSDVADETVPPEQRFLVPYDPRQINNPEGMIATYSHILAHYMAQLAEQRPPGGTDLWQQATEILAIYLGFGVMFANSAYVFRGGCGSCGNSTVARQASLTEQQASYALALFAVLKDIPDSAVTKHLKKHLRSFYKRATKEIRQNQPLLEQFGQLRQPA